LKRASYIGNEKIVELLLQNKANPLERDCDGKTALHKCVEKYLEKRTKNFEETIKILLKYNSSQLEISDKMNKTPLDYLPDLKNFLGS